MTYGGPSCWMFGVDMSDKIFRICILFITLCALPGGVIMGCFSNELGLCCKFRIRQGVFGDFIISGVIRHFSVLMEGYVPSCIR